MALSVPSSLMNEESLTQNLHSFKDKLREMPRDMRIFSLCMRSLYVESAVGSDEEPAKNFRQLRDDTRNDAMVYLKCLLPLTTEFVRSIKMFFEYFLHLDFEEWKESLPDIIEDAAGYKQVCDAMLKGHEEILVPLKQREDKAKQIMSEFKDLQEKYEEEVKKLKNKVDNHEAGIKLFAQGSTWTWTWSIALSFIPVVGIAVCKALKSRALKEIAEKSAAETQSEINHRAAYVVETVLIPALQKFIEGLSSSAGFFSIMQQELQTFEERGSSENPKKIHYKIMNKEAAEINTLCQEFYAVLPEVRTDFLAIPTEGTDQNYVDKWLEKQKKMIEEQCSVKSILKGMLKALADTTVMEPLKAVSDQ